MMTTMNIKEPMNHKNIHKYLGLKFLQRIQNSKSLCHDAANKKRKEKRNQLFMNNRSLVVPSTSTTTTTRTPNESNQIKYSKKKELKDYLANISKLFSPRVLLESLPSIIGIQVPLRRSNRLIRLKLSRNNNMNGNDGNIDNNNNQKQPIQQTTTTISNQFKSKSKSPAPLVKPGPVMVKSKHHHHHHHHQTLTLEPSSNKKFCLQSILKSKHDDDNLSSSSSTTTRRIKFANETEIFYFGRNE